MVPIVFDWPTHTNIWAYVWGDDGERAREAGHDLVREKSLAKSPRMHQLAERITVTMSDEGGGPHAAH